MDYGNTKAPSMPHRMGSVTLLQLAFPGESNPNFPWGKSHWDNTVVKNRKKSKRLYSTGNVEDGCRQFYDIRILQLNSVPVLITLPHANQAFRLTCVLGKQYWTNSSKKWPRISKKRTYFQSDSRSFDPQVWDVFPAILTLTVRYDKNNLPFWGVGVGESFPLS